jgi:soluble lytic murein transglycosylase-like protein
MTRRAVALALLAALAASCTSSAAVPRSTGTTGATGTTGTSPSPEPEEELPTPYEEIPPQGSALARVLEDTVAANRSAIEAWVDQGDPASWPPPKEVVLLTLYEQRLYRTLVAHPKLAGRVLGRLERRTAAEAGANVRAGRAVYEHFSPVDEVPDYRIRRPEGADALLGYFLEAQDRFGVAWEVLAAIMLVETRMGRIRSRSPAGARGPMQFLPATWDAYGMGGDVLDPHDAVLGAANYLDASGAPEDYKAALYAYNPVKAYVTSVWLYAKTMTRFPESYYAYYNWQVFVRTVDGDVRLSGPGL